MSVEVDEARTELVAIGLWDLGAVGIEELPGVLRAAFTSAATAERARDIVAPTSGIDEVDDTFGVDESRDLLGIEFAGGFAIHPPWLAAPHGIRSLIIDPGLSFGSGSHPSTRLALELIEVEVREGSLVFDVGCGSGVLAIGAALLGASVVAVDVDPHAVDAVVANAQLNAVAERVTAVAGSIDHVTTHTDLVTINVTIDIHEALASSLSFAHRRLVVAGVLGTVQLERAAAAYGATVEHSIEQDGWMAAVLARS